MASHKLTFDKVQDAIMSDSGIGFCIKCGKEGHEDWYEPDRRKCLCIDCGAMTVYGAQEVMIMMGEYLQ